MIGSTLSRLPHTVQLNKKRQCDLQPSFLFTHICVISPQILSLDCHYRIPQKRSNKHFTCTIGIEERRLIGRRRSWQYTHIHVPRLSTKSKAVFFDTLELTPRSYVIHHAHLLIMFTTIPKHGNNYQSSNSIGQDGRWYNESRTRSISWRSTSHVTAWKFFTYLVHLLVLHAYNKARMDNQYQNYASQTIIIMGCHKMSTYKSIRSVIIIILSSNDQVRRSARSMVREILTKSGCSRFKNTTQNTLPQRRKSDIEVWQQTYILFSSLSSILGVVLTLLKGTKQPNVD